MVVGEVEAQIQEGHPDVLESQSFSEPLMAVFEDDGETGYFYALDLSGTQGQKIADAVQIYSVVAGGQGTVARVIRIAWSLDGWKAGLLVDGILEAVFDFAGRRGISRTGFPPARDEWTRQRALSEDQLLAAFSARAV